VEIEEASTSVEIQIATSSSQLDSVQTDEALVPFDIDDFIGINEVEAEEYITSEIQSLSDLGTLQEAKVFLSLAVKQDKKQGELILYKDLELDYDDLIEMASTSLATTTVIEVIDTVSSGSTEIKATSSIIDVVEIEESTSTVEIIEEITASSTDMLSWMNEILQIKDAKAQNELLKNAGLVLWYSLGEKQASSSDIVWQMFDTINADNISNYTNNGYFEFDAPFLTSFEEIGNLEIKIEGKLPNGTVTAVYLDSIWVEAIYVEETELDRIKKRERWENALELLSDNLVFSASDRGEMEFKYNKNEERIWDTLKEMMGVGNFWQDVSVDAELIDSKGLKIDIPLVMMFEADGIFSIRLGEIRELKPGEYTIRFHIVDNSGEVEEVFDIGQKFSWGVIAMNFNKHEYAVGEEAKVQMAVLDKLGHTECEAEIQHPAILIF